MLDLLILVGDGSLHDLVLGDELSESVVGDVSPLLLPPVITILPNQWQLVPLLLGQIDVFAVVHCGYDHLGDSMLYDHLLSFVDLLRGVHELRGALLESLDAVLVGLDEVLVGHRRAWEHSLAPFFVL